MSDDHLIAPADAVLPSPARGWGITAGVLVMWILAFGVAHQLRGAEVDATAQARAVAPESAEAAPPATFPGGVDQRALDPSASRAHPPADGPHAPPPAGARPPHHRGHPNPGAPPPAPEPR